MKPFYLYNYSNVQDSMYYIIAKKLFKIVRQCPRYLVDKVALGPTTTTISPLIQQAIYHSIFDY